MAMVEREVTALSIVDSLNVDLVAQTMQKVAQFQAIVHKNLKDGHDFGIIPGTGDKPTLLKPGAEKILMLMGLTSEYEIVEKVQNYETGFFAFTVKCTLSKSSIKITEGFGHANTRESRYTNRWVTEKKIPEGIDKASLKTREKESKFKPGDFYTEYLMENSDGYTLANTVLKMAKKRSQVDATLTVASLSDLFTQDLEDLTPPGEPAKPAANGQRPAPQQGKPAQQKPTTQSNSASLSNNIWNAFWAHCHEIGFNKKRVNHQAAIAFDLQDDPDALVDNKNPEKSIIKTQADLDKLTRAIEDQWNIEKFNQEVQNNETSAERVPGED